MDIPNDKLVRGLGPLDATMIVIGSMIGSGIFITSAESTRLISAPGWLLLAWTMAGLLTITGALCCAELAAMMPRAGGQYVFLRQAYGPAIGFLFGWTLFLVIQTGTIAAVAIAFAKFAGVFFPAIGTEHYLVRPVHLVGDVCDQSFDGATHRGTADSSSHLGQHPRPGGRQTCAKYLHLRQDRRAHWIDRRRAIVRLAGLPAPPARRIGGIRGRTGGLRSERSPV